MGDNSVKHLEFDFHTPKIAGDLRPLYYGSRPNHSLVSDMPLQLNGDNPIKNIDPMIADL